jgi:hypothetical protein
LEIKIGAMVDLATANACILKIKCLQMLANTCKCLQNWCYACKCLHYENKMGHLPTAKLVLLLNLMLRCLQMGHVPNAI